MFEEFTLSTVFILAGLVVLFYIVSRRREEIFGGSKKKVATQKSRGDGLSVGNPVGGQFSSGQFGEFEGLRRIK